MGTMLIDYQREERSNSLMEERIRSSLIEDPDIVRRQYNLPDHHSTTLQTLDILRSKREFCDVVLRCGEQHIPAHRCVLAANSTFFRTMFSWTSDYQAMGTFHLQDSPSILSLLVDFMYTGSLVITEVNMIALFEMADYYDMPRAVSVCGDFIQQQINASVCVDIFNTADMHNYKDLKKFAWDFMLQYLTEIVKHEDFYNMRADTLVELCNSNKLAVHSEKEVFDAADVWLTHHPTKCCQVVPRLPLDRLARHYLQENVYNSQYVKQCNICLSHVEELIQSSEHMMRSKLRKKRQPHVVYIIGGAQVRNQNNNSPNGSMATMAMYSVVQDDWQLKETRKCHKMRTARSFAGAAALDGRLYVVGGQNVTRDNANHDLLRSVEMYNTESERWSECAPLPNPVARLGVCALGGYIYAIGGENTNQSFSSVDRYNPASNTWTPVTDMHRPRSAAGVAVLKDKIYVAGGYDRSRSADLSSMEVYEDGRWSFCSELARPCSGLSLVALHHYLYALGGGIRADEMPNLKAERFDVVSQQWSSIRELPGACAWSSPRAAILANKLIVMSTNHRFRYEYNAEDNEWSTGKEVRRVRVDAAMVVM